jgi:hypothetical protein
MTAHISASGNKWLPSVSRVVGLPLVKVMTPHEFRPPAKDLPATDHDAVHVAALNLQHLVLCALRRLSSGDLTADLSQLLAVSPRKAQRIIAATCANRRRLPAPSSRPCPKRASLT